MINRYFKDEERRRRFQAVAKNNEIITPLRLQAYERIILFLERISPENLLVRIDKPGNTCRKLHADLLSTIRAEYEHNLTQQLYVSTHAWEAVKNARTYMIHLINTSFENINPDEPSLSLSRIIMDKVMNQSVSLISEAIKIIKDELNQLSG